MKKPIRIPHSLTVLFTTAVLFGCTSPSTQPAEPPAGPPGVNLSGVWEIYFESDALGARVGPYVWQLVQTGTSVEVYSLTHPNDPCGNYEQSVVMDNMWTLVGSFNPTNCPGFDPIAGTISANVEIRGDNLAGAVTVTITAPADIAGTYAGGVFATRKQ